MNKLFGLFLLALAFIVPPTAANAACSGGACFWIGGTGTVDGTLDNGKWATTSGGASCACVPSTTDSVTFDGSSGTGTVTINMGGALWTVSSFTMSLASGLTIDFATNSNSLTVTGTGGFAASGASTKTLNLGSGTFSLSVANNSVAWDTSGSGLTLNAGTSTIAFTGTFTNNNGFRRFFGGGKTYATLSVSGGGMPVGLVNASNTFGAVVLNAPARLYISPSTTQTITTLTAPGTSASNSVFITNDAVDSGNRGTISSANNFTCNFCALSMVSFTGAGTFSATNSYGQNTTGITISGPSGGGGGGRIIGG